MKPLPALALLLLSGNLNSTTQPTHWPEGGFCYCASQESEWSPWRTYSHEWPKLHVKWRLE